MVFASPALEAAAKHAASVVRAHKVRWVLACDTDADGLCAAAVTFWALRQVGLQATIRASRDKTAASYDALVAQAEGVIFLDKGTSHAVALKQAQVPIVILDHHNAPWAGGPHDPTRPSDRFAIVNPRLCGLDGSHDASAATTCVAFALALVGKKALQMAPVALSGAIGDWQHMPAWRGWNRELLEQSRHAGFLTTRAAPSLVGVTLALALSHARDPIPGLDGDVEACKAFLDRLDLPHDVDAEALDSAQATRLVSALAARHIAAGRQDLVAQLVAPLDWNARLDRGIRQVFRIVDACGREGHAATGVAFLLGDPSATVEALDHFAASQRHLSQGLDALRKDPPIALEAVQYAWTREPGYSGMVAGLGLVHGVPNRSKALCILAKRGDGAIQVSTRGLPSHVEAGLDLGTAVAQAAAHVGSEGGGHPIAAGAVVDASKVQDFLARLDEELVQQRYRA